MAHTFVPTAQVSLSITPATPISGFDRDHPGGDGRVIGVRIGESLTVQFTDFWDGDADIIASTGSLIDALAVIRDAARRRLAETVTAELPDDGVLFISTMGQFLDGLTADPGDHYVREAAAS